MACPKIGHFPNTFERACPESGLVLWSFKGLSKYPLQCWCGPIAVQITFKPTQPADPQPDFPKFTNTSNALAWQLPHDLFVAPAMWKVCHLCTYACTTRQTSHQIGITSNIKHHASSMKHRTWNIKHQSSTNVLLIDRVSVIAMPTPTPPHPHPTPHGGGTPTPKGWGGARDQDHPQPNQAPNQHTPTQPSTPHPTQPTPKSTGRGSFHLRWGWGVAGLPNLLLFLVFVSTVSQKSLHVVVMGWAGWAGLAGLGWAGWAGWDAHQ